MQLLRRIAALGVPGVISGLSKHQGLLSSPYLRFNDNHEVFYLILLPFFRSESHLRYI